MQLTVIARLEDAHAVVRRYKLEHYDWGEFATAEGFADHLFANGRAHTTLALAAQMQTYIDHCQESAANGQDWDAELRAERNFYESALNARAEKRAALASMIREVKFGEMGGRIWSTVAELATSAAPQEWFAQKPALAIPVAKFLKSLWDIREHHTDSLEMDYAPGVSKVDYLIRLDVEQFDETLATAPPWSGRDPDWFYELCALLRLAGNPSIQSALDRLVATERVDS